MSVLSLIQKNESCNIFCKFGIEYNQRYYNTNLLGKELGDNVRKVLPFSQASTGCDTISSFHNQRKLQIFDAWIS